MKVCIDQVNSTELTTGKIKFNKKEITAAALCTASLIAMPYISSIKKEEFSYLKEQSTKMYNNKTASSNSQIDNIFAEINFEKQVINDAPFISDFLTESLKVIKTLAFIEGDDKADDVVNDYYSKKQDVKTKVVFLNSRKV